MTAAQWKLVMDQQGVTITNDRFQFTTLAGEPVAAKLVPMDDAAMEAALVQAESAQMEAMVADLQAMTRRTYGQYCGLTRAVEVLGERWVMLIIRDLLVSPKSVQELHTGLPRLAEETLVSRLGELERTGIVQRTEGSDPVVYELTSYGADVDDAILKLGLWGARMLDDPRPEDIVTPDSVVMALRSMFVPEKAKGLHASYELRVDDEITVHARINDGTITAGRGPLPGADLVLEPGDMLMPILTGEVDAADVVKNKSFYYTGDPSLLIKFGEIFHIPGLAG